MSLAYGVYKLICDGERVTVNCNMIYQVYYINASKFLRELKEV